MSKSQIKQLEDDKHYGHMVGCLYALNKSDIECYKYVVKQDKIENDMLLDILGQVTHE